MKIDSGSTEAALRSDMPSSNNKLSETSVKKSDLSDSKIVNNVESVPLNVDNDQDFSVTISKEAENILRTESNGGGIEPPNNVESNGGGIEPPNNVESNGGGIEPPKKY